MEIITINAHGLNDFIQCPRKFILSEVYEREKNLAMEKGILFAKFLEIYYKRKRQGRKFLLSPFWTTTIARRLNCSAEEAQQFWRACYKYLKEYENCPLKPLAIEAGFSRLLYESDELKIILEGRPDLVAYHPELGRIVIDHKTQSSFRPLPDFNHQVMAYVYASQSQWFMYNYIIFTKEPRFERKIFKVTEEQIQYWKDNTIEIVKSMLSNKFLPNFNCLNQYGLCHFYNVCTAPNPRYQQWILETQFKRRKERLKSWS